MNRVLAPMKNQSELTDKLFEKLGADVVCHILHKLSISPNILTLINKLFSLLALYFLFINYHFFLLFIFIMFFTDILDGYYARKYHMETMTGLILDHGGDVLFTVFAIFKSYLYFMDTWILLILTYLAVEIAIELYFKYYKERLPTRIFLYFYIFGFYKLGLFVQLIWGFTTFIIYLFYKRSEVRRS